MGKLEEVVDSGLDVLVFLSTELLVDDLREVLQVELVTLEGLVALEKLGYLVVVLLQLGRLFVIVVGFHIFACKI